VSAGLALPFPVLSDSEGGVTDLYVKHIDLPAEVEIRDWFEFIELQCEECFPSEWPL
jgi:hypothetical protein